MALFVVDVDAGAGLQLVKVIMRKAAVMRERACRKVHVAVGFVSVPLVDERLHDLDDLGDVFGRARMHGRRTDAQPLRVGEIRVDIARGDFGHGAALGLGLGDHLIVHVGEVLHEHDLVAAVFEIAAQQVEKHEAARVADVDIVVDRRAAGVHPHPAVADGQFFLLSCQRIKKPHVRLSFTNRFVQTEGSRKFQYCRI